jgi:AraC-like DNA-binding protein
MEKKIPDIKFNKSKGVSGFEIMSLSELNRRAQKTLDHKPHHPHRINFYMMLYVIEGSGHHSVDFHSIFLKKGTLIFIAPGQVHCFEKQREYEGYMCLFTEDFLAKESLQLSDRYMIDNLYLRDITKALVLEDKSMEDFFHLLQKEFFAMHVTQKTGVVSSLLRSILVKSINHFDEDNVENSSSELFFIFKKTLLDNYKDIHNAEEYATLLKVSPKHLNLTCKRLTGLTTKAFIDRFMIVETKRYLTSSTLPIKEIATKMGYWEVSNFVKFFKKHTNMTPKAFRDLQHIM